MFIGWHRCNWNLECLIVWALSCPLVFDFLVISGIRVIKSCRILERTLLCIKHHHNNLMLVGSLTHNKSNCNCFFFGSQVSTLFVWPTLFVWDTMVFYRTCYTASTCDSYLLVLQVHTLTSRNPYFRLPPII